MYGFQGTNGRPVNGQQYQQTQQAPHMHAAQPQRSQDQMPMYNMQQQQQQYAQQPLPHQQAYAYQQQGVVIANNVSQRPSSTSSVRSASQQRLSQAPVCIKCGLLCETEGFVALKDGVNFHRHCFACEYCQLELPLKFASKRGKYFHIECYSQVKASCQTCTLCANYVMPHHHAVQLDTGAIYHADTCYICEYCKLALGDVVLPLGDQLYHQQCMTCVQCTNTLENTLYDQLPNGYYACIACLAAQWPSVYGQQYQAFMQQQQQPNRQLSINLQYKAPATQQNMYYQGSDIQVPPSPSSMPLGTMSPVSPFGPTTPISTLPQVQNAQSLANSAQASPSSTLSRSAASAQDYLKQSSIPSSQSPSTLNTLVKPKPPIAPKPILPNGVPAMQPPSLKAIQNLPPPLKLPQKDVPPPLPSTPPKFGSQENLAKPKGSLSLADQLKNISLKSTESGGGTEIKATGKGSLKRASLIGTGGESNKAGNGSELSSALQNAFGKMKQKNQSLLNSKLNESMEEIAVHHMAIRRSKLGEEVQDDQNWDD